MAIIPILVVAAPIAVGVLAKLLEHVNEPEDERRLALERTPVTKVAALRRHQVDRRGDPSAVDFRPARAAWCSCAEVARLIDDCGRGAH